MSLFTIIFATLKYFDGEVKCEIKLSINMKCRQNAKTIGIKCRNEAKLARNKSNQSVPTIKINMPSQHEIQFLIQSYAS